MEDDHLVPLDHGWSLWRWVALRGAGFPASRLAALGSSRAAGAADRLVAQLDTEAAARAHAVATLQAQLRDVAGDARKPITRVLKKLGRGETPDATELPDDALRVAAAAVAAERAAAVAVYDAEQHRISDALRAVAGDVRFHEAVLWQNRAAVHGGFAWLRRQPADEASSRTRKIEAAVASYLQRYCAKNETIGFFGPLGWATLEPSDDRACLRPGPTLLSRRDVYFEHWAIIELADQIRSAAIRRQLAPRRNPAMRLDGTTLVPSAGPEVRLPAAVAAVLAACDGATAAVTLARALVADGRYDFADEDDVFALLDELQRKRLVDWGVEIPFDAEAPEHALRDQLARLTGTEQILATLDELAAARGRVAAAVGDVVALDAALGEVDATFERATGVGATRRHGENYAGRTLVFEDCERDIELRLGPTFTRSFAPALALVLESVRWLSFRIAEHARGELDRAHAELGGGTVPLARVLERIPSLPDGLKSSDRDVTGELLAELDRRWRDALGIAMDEPVVRRTSAELAPAVRAAFAAPRPGWPGARHHSVDLMFAARSFDELARGDGLAVLGEVHPCGAHLAAPVFVRACPWREDVFRAYRRGTQTAQVMVPPSKRNASRTACGPRVAAEFTLDVGMRSVSPPERVLAPSELVVEATPAGLVVRTRDGRARFDAVTFCAAWLKDAADRFSLLTGAAHVPRVVIDNLVIQRRTWRMAPDDAGFARLDRGVDQFAQARRWARARDIPRFVFVKIPEELKPVFVDLDSPVGVEMMAKLVRGASRLTVSEMLPSLDELWLPDADGELYTSELRLTAVDPIAWSA